MKKIVLGLLTVFMVLSLSVALVKADATTTTVTLEDGVQIRTDGNNGLKWEATVANHVDGNEYGFLFAQGDLAEVTVETTNVVKQVVEGVSAEQLTMAATMTKFPKKSVAQDISVVAYVLADGVYTYSNVVVRNLAEVAVYAKNTIDGDFVNAVAEYVGANYKNVYTDTLGNVFVTNAVYETNPANLEKAFLADWNAKFGTELTEFEYSSWQASAKDGSTPLTANSETDCSGTNAYEFFNTDAATSAKWGWLLNFFLAETSTKVHPKRQITALQGEGAASDSYGGQMHQLAHLARSLQNFFDAEGTSVTNNAANDITITDLSVYNNIATYNKTVYAQVTELVAVESDYDFNAVSKTGYEFVGYNDGTNNYDSSVTVSADAFFTPVFEATEYAVKFYYEGVEIEELTTTYTIENAVALPEYELSGYKFLGWYDNAELEGDVVTSIAAGSTGAKEYHAKLQEAYTVTYNLNGGNIRYASFAEMSADFVADFNATTGKSVTASGLYGAGNCYHTFFNDAEMFAKWSWTLELFIELGELGYGANSEATAQYETFLAGEGSTVSVQWAVRQSLQALMTLNKCGNYSGAACPDFGLAEVQLLVFGAVNGGIETEKYVGETAVIENAYRTGYTFAGWYDNAELEGDAVTTVTEATTLYAKWNLITYTVTYVLNNEDATVEKEEDEVSTLDYYVLATPSYDVAKWQFLGWFTDEECTQPISTISEFNESDITVYASWAVVTGFQVTYNFNGGNTKYADKEAVVTDLLADINAHFDKSYTKTSFPSSKWGSNLSFNEMFKSTLSYKAKWQWLLDFLYATETNSGNKTAIGKLSGAVSSSWNTQTDPYGATYVFYAFINSKCQDVHSSYVTIDYSLDENNQFWDELSAAEVTVYNNTTEIVNNVYKYGYTFGGWYTTEDFQEGTQVTTITANCTLYAKWVEAAE